MASTSIYKIAEKVRDILQKGNLEAIISSCIDCYAIVAKNQFYENKKDGVGEVDGVFIYNFGKTEPLAPTLDVSTDMYYIVIPSSYLRLPCEYGINSVSFLKGQTKPFVRVGAGSVGMWVNLKANCLGGHQTYFVEGTQMFFPKMTASTKGNMMLKLTVALDTIDPEQDLNIPPDVAGMIVDMVVEKYRGKPEVKPETL
ncbi:MAG: hypothetical protein V4721_10165 [Bacteroidota bacterium]